MSGRCTVLVFWLLMLDVLIRMETCIKRWNKTNLSGMGCYFVFTAERLLVILTETWSSLSSLNEGLRLEALYCAAVDSTGLQ